MSGEELESLIKLMLVGLPTSSMGLCNCLRQWLEPTGACALDLRCFGWRRAKRNHFGVALPPRPSAYGL
jgi:hypothetical protein